MTAKNIVESKRADLPLPTGHMNERDQRVYNLNMIKLAHLLPHMQLTVEERLCIQGLLDAYHGPGILPPYPWTARESEKAKG
jgi:hypothetical protein